MRYPIAIALIIVGVILLILGVSASHSFASHVSNAVTGHPTNEAIWLVVIGAACGLLGLIALAPRHLPPP